ncbi:MAG: 3-methyl-2-oxobutanoate dehydrogenase subunit beta [Gemmatimonadota bacterium]|nr:MAG: 3-methyl-2-oxobutanoate dehydrogenase subunit beta [Gemmatimonadota bacterium]
MRFQIPEHELMGPGHVACPGCGAAQAMRYVLKALGEKTIVVLPACCWSIIAGPFPYSSLQVPLYHTAFETAGAAASGIKAGLEIQGDTDTTVLAWAGDGGTFDIGIQALSGAAERNDDILYVCYDNEAYMNTGIQRSSATPWGAWTTTTPVRHFKNRPKKDIMMVMAAHKIPYAATATVAFPDDLVAKVQKAKTIHGTRFLHILSPCPPGWKIPSEIAIRLARLAIETKIFPLYEIENGEKYTITRQPDGVPVIEYLKFQGRFKHLTKSQMDDIQDMVEKEWENLLSKTERSH